MGDYRTRVPVFIGVILVVLGILGARLLQLQIVSSEEYTAEARSNAIRDLRVLPARGAFYDRDGTLVVENSPTYTITLTPRFFDESKIGMLADLLEVPDSLVAARLREARAWSAFRPSRSFRQVPFEAFSRVQEHLHELPGVNFEVGQARRYTTGAQAAHAFGYIREIADAELKRMREDGYRMGDLIGKTGLERRYESFLRGRMGSELRMVNSRGLQFAPYRGGAEDVAPFSGYDLHLTMDAELQALAESLFVGKRGGAVALDPETGGILSIVSSPDYDPSIFTRSIEDSTWTYLTQSWKKPMLNRATMSRMPPGSTWKPFMALMALQEGLITPEETVFCPGYHPFGGPSIFRCMHRHGAVNVVEAIQHSCNTFFFEMMFRASLDQFSRYAHLFGFGEQAPTDLMEQDPGLVADSAYFRRKTGMEDWGKGWELSLGIGQGDIVVTPLQMARYVMAVANGGELHAPHLVDYLAHPRTGEQLYPAVPAPEEIPVQEDYFQIVREGMKRVMEAGTGYYVQIPGIPSGGKTGTAQAANKGKDDSIFIMFAPYDDPQIAIAVMVENAGYGSVAAGPIASLMAEQYLTGEIADTPERQAVLRRALTARSAVPPTVN